MLAIVLLLLFLVPASGWTATYYVATTGNDSNSCSKAQNMATPKRTIRSGLSCPGPGDMLYIRGGTYAESNLRSLPSGTDWSHAITIKTFPGDANAVIQTSSGQGVLHLLGERYLIFESLIFDGNNRTGATITVDGYPPYSGAVPHTHHVKFLNCEFRNSMGEISVGHSLNIEFIGGSVHDNGDESGLRHGFYLSDVADVLIDGMQIYNNTGYGVHLSNGDGAPSDKSVRVITRNNVLYNNGTAATQCGIIYSGTSDGLIYNNVTYGNAGGGICVGHAGYAENNGIYHNTVVGNFAGSGFYGLYIAGGGINNIVRNNIIWDNNGRDYGNFGSGTVFDHNLQR